MASRASLYAILLCVALIPGGGCYHLIEPIRPVPIPVEEPFDLFPPGLAVRMINGLETPQRLPLRSEGIHHMEVDLRDWSARLLSELAFELTRRRVRVVVPSDSLAGTTSVNAPVPRQPTPGTTGAPTLRVTVLEVRAPSPEEGTGPFLRADLESVDGELRATHSTTPAVRTFQEAFDELKRAFLLDASFRGFLLERGPIGSPPS